MRHIRVLLFLILLGSPAIANGQSFLVHGAAGPTITDPGYSFAVGAGISAGSRTTVAFSFDQTHLSSQTTREGNTVSSVRGGTLFLGTAEVQFSPYGRRRTGPFVLAGVASGISRPNVNAAFPDAVTNYAGAVFLGGGLNVPVNERVLVFADVRMMIGAEGTEGIIGVVPVRAGLAWRF